MQSESQATFFFFSGNDGYAKVEIIINSDQSWYIVLDGKKRDNAKILGEWADIPGVITLVSELQLLMSTGGVRIKILKMLFRLMKMNQSFIQRVMMEQLTLCVGTLIFMKKLSDP